MKNARKNAGLANKRFHSLAAAQEARGLTQTEMARMLGKDVPYVNKLIHRTARPSLEMAILIERVFNVDPAGLL